MATTTDRKLTHVDEQGRASMVDIGAKPASQRMARAAARVRMQPETLGLIKRGNVKKGDVLSVARIAGIMGAKRTADLIPLCHPLALERISLKLELNEADCAVEIEASVRTSGKTGVEMEALTAVSVAALTIYDMAKAVDRAMRITDIRLLEKRGGVHGDFLADDQGH